MFEATIRAGRLREVLDAAGVLVDECRIHVCDEGLLLRAADPAMVALVDITLDAEAFESYEADGELLGIEIDRLAEVCRIADDDSLARLELDAEKRRLHVDIGSLSYELGLLDPSSIREEPDLPSVDPPATVVLEGEHLDRGIEAADMVADHLRLRVDDDVFVIEAEGDTDDVSVEFTRGDLLEVAPGQADSLYSLAYLTAMSRAIPGDAAVRLELGEEFLAGIQYEYAEGGPAVSYHLAPRLQTA